MTTVLTLFDEAAPERRVQYPTPVAPGSATSREAAEELDRTGKRQKQVARCLRWFGEQAEPRTRNELAAALYGGHLGSACGRANDLMTMGWIAEVGRQGKRATLSITANGRRALGEERAA